MKIIRRYNKEGSWAFVGYNGGIGVSVRAEGDREDKGLGLRTAADRAEAASWIATTSHGRKALCIVVPVVRDERTRYRLLQGIISAYVAMADLAEETRKMKRMPGVNDGERWAELYRRARVKAQKEAVKRKAQEEAVKAKREREEVWMRRRGMTLTEKLRDRLRTLYGFPVVEQTRGGLIGLLRAAMEKTAAEADELRAKLAELTAKRDQAAAECARAEADENERLRGCAAPGETVSGVCLVSAAKEPPVGAERRNLEGPVEA